MELTVAEPASSFVEGSVSDLTSPPAGSMHAVAPAAAAATSSPPPNKELEAPNASMQIKLSPARLLPKFVEVSVSEAASLCTGASIAVTTSFTTKASEALPPASILVAMSVSDPATPCSASGIAATASLSAESSAASPPSETYEYPDGCMLANVSLFAAFASMFVDMSVRNLALRSSGAVQATAASLSAESYAALPLHKEELVAPDASMHVKFSSANVSPTFVETSVSDLGMPS